MAFNVAAANLTPSRPAPQAPLRRPADSPVPNNARQNSSYNPSFSSSSSYASDYTGIGGSPIRYSDASMNSQIIRNGMVSLKEEGFASFMFLRKWLVLKGDTLTIHKTEVRGVGSAHDRSFAHVCTPLVFRTTKRDHVAGYNQYRTSRSEALLSAARNQRQAIPSCLEK